jgi:hypothetical protein
MDPNRKTAIIVGVLFLTAIGTYNLGVFLIDSIVDDSDFLINVSNNENKLVLGAILILVDCAAVVILAVLLYPVLKRYNKPIALGYVGFRIIECTTLIIAVISTLLLITLSQDYVKAGAPGDSYFQTIGTLLKEVHYWTYQIVILIFSSIFGTLLAYLLYQSKLIPRFISILGLVGYPLLLPMALFGIFGYGEITILLIPGGLFEILFPIWLIFNGFDSPAIDSGPAEN